MIRPPPSSTRTDTRFPYTTLFRSVAIHVNGILCEIRPSARLPVFPARARRACGPDWELEAWRSEEHTSELQSLMRISYAVFCLKKKNKYAAYIIDTQPS